MVSRLLLVVLSGALLPVVARADPTLFSVSPRSAVLRTVDAADGSTLDASVVITLSGEIVLGVNGLARHPQSGTLYALLRLLGEPTRWLVTLDPATGVATSVGDTGDKFAALAFASDGTLYGVTGEGASTPETLYTLSTANAAATVVSTLGNGTDGEALAYDSRSGLLYHASGIGDPNTDEILETIDPGTLVVSNVPLLLFDYEELTVLAYVHGGFYAGDLGDALVDMPRFFRVSRGGAVVYLGDMDHVSKGLVPVEADVLLVPALSSAMIGLQVVALLVIGWAGIVRRRSR
ncbi:MAG: hypothetical protein ACYTAF_12085 [Planctomycetota bacterium]|jgi:hypothetical protein